MSRARKVPLGDVLALDRDGVPVDPAETYRMAGVRSFGRGLFARAPISGAETSYKQLYRLSTGQIVLSRLFGWEGAVAQVTPAFEGMLVSSEFPTFTVDETAADLSYVGHFVRWSGFHEQLAGATRGLGQRRQRVEPDRLLGVPIPLPPIEEQRHVAAHLDQITSGVDSLRALAERSTHLGTAARAALARSTSTTGTAWRSVSVRDVMRIQLDEVAVDPAATYPMAGVYSFGRGLFARGDLDGGATSYQVLHRLSKGQMVMSRLKAWEGALALVQAEFDGNFLSPEFPTFEIDHEVVDPGFLSTLLTTRSFWERLRVASKGIGARKERVHAEQLLDERLELPPLDEQRRRASAIAVLDSHRRRLDARSRRVGALVPAALNQAFSDLT